ncbi:MAG: FAD-binding protein, partial [Chloroflexi bacterium]|nr:FAD-binding protein [Chloroflexota bacterium]
MTTDNTSVKLGAKQAMERAIGATNVSDVVEGRAVDGVFPKVVATPNSVDELASVMRSAHQSGLAVAPWGGGTRIDLGNAISRL